MWLFKGNIGKKSPTPHCLCRTCTSMFSVRKWNPNIRVYQIDQVEHVLDVAKAIRLANDQFDFVIGDLNSRVARTKPDCIQYVFSVTLDLEV